MMLRRILFPAFVFPWVLLAGDPAEFQVTTRVLAPDPGAWTATIGTTPEANNLMPGGGFEQFHLRGLVVPNQDADNCLHLDANTMTVFDSYAEPYYDGARVRIYRVVDGRMKLVRTDRVPPGGARASGWVNALENGGIIAAGTNRASFAFPGWQRPDYDYFFAVAAVDEEGNSSAPSAAVKVQRPTPSKGEQVKPENTLRSDSLPDPAERLETSAPPVPTNLRVTGTDPATGMITFEWDPVSAPDLAGYRLLFSNADPAKHRGYGLDLEGRAADHTQKIRRGDLAIVELDKDTMSRKRDWAPRLWGTHLVALPGGIAFYPDEDEGRTWAFVEHEGRLPDDFTAPGRKCLKVTVSEGQPAEAAQWKFGSRSQNYYMVLEPQRPIVVEVWLKKEKNTPLNFEFECSDHGFEPPFPAVFEPTTEWKKYTFETTPTREYDSEIVGQVKWKVSGEGTLFIDNLRVYHKDRPFMQPPPDVVEALKKSGLHAIRLHGFIKSGTSYAMSDLLAGPGETSIPSDDTLGNMLRLVAAAGSNPWLQIEMHMRPEEWAGLIEYLAAPYDPRAGDTPQKKPWAAMRYQQGQAKPWSEVFEKIYFEISNETWNPPFQPWIFTGREMTDAATGKKYSSGELYGLWQTMVDEQLAASPYWPALKDKWEVVLGGWTASMGEEGYGTKARLHAPNARHLTIGPYNGGWDEGVVPAEANDEGRSLALTFVPQRGDITSRQLAEDREVLRAQGFDFLPGTYEAGPGYALPGTIKEPQMEAESLVMKSQAGGAATLDAFLNAATHGFRLQNMFCFGFGRHFWATHVRRIEGGQPHPWWRACTELYNLRGTGDFLTVNTLSAPARDLPATPTRPAIADAPMVACYATRKGDRFNVFLISRKLDNYPSTGDDGFTPVTVDLPFTSAKKVTLHAMDGDPRATNLDADAVKIRSVNIPTDHAGNKLVLGPATGADARGLPPASIFLYVFEGVGGVTETPDAPPTIIHQPEQQSVEAGFSPVFRIGVEAGFPRTFTMQWERRPSGGEWQAVSGATASILRLPSATADDDGAEFRCRVADPKRPGFEAISEPARLTVKPFGGPVFRRAAAPPPNDPAAPEWAAATPVELAVSADGKAAPATVRGQWDDTALHLLVEVRDREGFDTSGQPWVGDGFEVFLDPLNSKTTTYRDGHRQIYVGGSASGKPVFAKGSNSGPVPFNHLQGHTMKTADGWAIAVSIPWSATGVKPGALLGIDVVLADRTADGQTHKRSLADNQNKGWENPSVFATAKLEP